MLKLTPPCPRQVATTTQGISRVLTYGEGPPAPEPLGGGDQNGTQATSILHGQAGTAAIRIDLPRIPRNTSPNYCGVV